MRARWCRGLSWKYNLLVRRFFELLSVPILVIPVSFIVIWLLIGASPLSQRWFLTFFLNVVVLPLFSIVWLERRRFVSDLDLRDKRERLAFLGLMVFVSSANFITSWLLSAPKVIQVLNLLVLILVAVMGIVTSFWKISGHMLVLASLITTAYLIKGNTVLILAFILPLAAVHRLYFRHHTPSQVLAGLVCGFLIPVLVVKFLGLN